MYLSCIWLKIVLLDCERSENVETRNGVFCIQVKVAKPFAKRAYPMGDAICVST
jgi:hypothetical protein